MESSTGGAQRCILPYMDPGPGRIRKRLRAVLREDPQQRCTNAPRDTQLQTGTATRLPPPPPIVIKIQLAKNSYPNSYHNFARLEAVSRGRPGTMLRPWLSGIAVNETTRCGIQLMRSCSRRTPLALHGRTDCHHLQPESRPQVPGPAITRQTSKGRPDRRHAQAAGSHQRLAGTGSGVDALHLRGNPTSDFISRSSPTTALAPCGPSLKSPTASPAGERPPRICPLPIDPNSASSAISAILFREMARTRPIR